MWGQRLGQRVKHIHEYMLTVRKSLRLESQNRQLARMGIRWHEGRQQYMKRTFSLVVVTLCAAMLAGVLSGCEALGIGNTGAGIPQVGQAKVSAPAISEDGTLRVGMDAANAPFSTLVDGKMVGIDVDIAAALADELGLKVKVVDVGANPIEALDAGTVDVVLGMDSADTSATCWLSDPYLQTAVAIFATSSGAILPSETSNVTIEAQESSMSAWEITNQYGEDALKTVANLKTVFDDLETGTTTYAAADAIIGSYVSHTSNGSAQIVGLMQKAGGYCVGVAASNNDLKPAISDAVSALRSQGVSDVVLSKWIGRTINYDSLALTEAAAKASTLASSDANGEDASNSSSATTELGAVGGNAVDLQDDGSQPGEDDNSVGVAEEYWGYGYDTANTQDYTQGYTDYTQTYTPDYTQPEQPVADDYTDAGTGDAGAVDAGAVDAGAGDVIEEAPVAEGGEEAAA